MNRAATRAPKDGGFTLIELLVVIVVIGTLAGIAILAVTAFTDDAEGAACTGNRRSLQTGLEGYNAGHHAYPGTLTQLTSGATKYVDVEGISGNVLIDGGYTLTYTPATHTLSACPASGSSGGGPGAPGAPGAPVLSAASDTGSSNSDRVTKDDTPSFTGSGATAGATVTLLAGGTQIGSAAATGGGTYSITSAPLPDAVHEVSALQTVAGVASATSGSVSVTVDTQAPSPPTITSPTEGATGVPREATLSGAASESGGSVTVTVKSTTPDKTSVPSDVAGAGPAFGWSVTFSSGDKLSNNNDQTATAQHTDLAGNASANGSARHFHTAIGA